MTDKLVESNATALRDFAELKSFSCQTMNAMTSSIRLPFPPSTNRLWRVVRGRAICSKSYRDWIAIAGAELMGQRPKKHQGAVTVSIELGPPDGRKTLDLLVKQRVIEGDDTGLLRSLSIRVGEGFVGARVAIESAA